MLLQTNSYIVPKDKRAEHARLVARFRQVLTRLGCDQFEAYEQVGANWSSTEPTGRFVQIMRFRDRKEQVAIQTAERTDPAAQELIREFCELINFPYQQQQGLFAVGFYQSAMPSSPARATPGPTAPDPVAPEAVRPRVESPVARPATPIKPPAEITPTEQSAEPPLPEIDLTEPPGEDDVEIDLTELDVQDLLPDEGASIDTKHPG